jgi:NAD(P)-dependent dehydrogenase (short-subunit alcohol dehydrogenase family)
MDATRVAVVTGAASGLGLAWPAELAQRGMRVVIADVNADGLAIAQREVRARTDALREGQLPEVAALVAKEVR